MVKPHPENLIPFSERPIEEVRAIQSKGGKAAAAQRRKRRKMRDDMSLLLGCEVTDTTMRQWLFDHDLDTNNQTLMCLKAILKAQDGDIEAARFVRDTAGEKPVAGVAVGALSSEELEGVDMRTLSEAELIAIANQEADE